MYNAGCYTIRLYVYDSLLEDCNLSLFMTNTLCFNIGMFFETIAVQGIKPERKKKQDDYVCAHKIYSIILSSHVIRIL